MSLFDCVDLLEERQKELDHGPTYIQHFLNFFSEDRKSEYFNSVEYEGQFIDTLKNKLISRLNNDDYHNIAEDIESINHFLENQLTPTSHYIQIKNDLIRTNRLLNQRYRSTTLLKNPNYMKYQNSDYKIAAINQTIDYRLGASEGVCLGYTYAMVDSNLSPYKNPGREIPFTRTIHDYQINQFSESHRIKRQRMTRRHFCPDIHKQAEEIFGIAEQHIGSEFDISRLGNYRGHSVYLSIQPDLQIRYMDANHGAYLFKTRSEWHEFYVLTSNHSKHIGNKYTSYRIDELHDAQDNVYVEQYTFEGKIRTLLTGPKYTQFSLALLTAVIASIVAIKFILYLFMSIVLSAVCISVSLSSPFVLISFILVDILSGIAALKGYFGMLAIPHLLEEYWYDFNEWLEQTEQPTPTEAPSHSDEIRPIETGPSNFHPRLFQTTHNELLLDVDRMQLRR